MGSPIREDERRNPQFQWISEFNRNQEDREEEVITRTINIIAKGITEGNTTKSAHKKHI